MNTKTNTIEPNSFIERDVFIKLSQLHPLILAYSILLDYGLIILTVFLCEYFWHSAIYIFAVIFIAGRQMGILSIGLHEGAHCLISKNRRINDLMAKSICLSLYVPAVIGFDDYRDSHFKHHLHLNTEEDPGLNNRQKLSKMPRLRKAFKLASMITGVPFVLILTGYIFKLKNWQQTTFNVSFISTTFLMVIVGCYLNFYPAIIIAMYWFVPLATWGLFVNYIRYLAEHYPESEFEQKREVPLVFQTRDVLNSWFDRLFVTTRGVNYHLCHHLFPQVPFYNLPQLQRELTKSEVYRQYAHINTSYHQVIWEHLTGKLVSFNRGQAVKHSDSEP